MVPKEKLYTSNELFLFHLLDEGIIGVLNSLIRICTLAADDHQGTLKEPASMYGMLIPELIRLRNKVKEHEQELKEAAKKR